MATSPLSSSPSSPSSSISHEDRFPYIETFTDNSEPEQVQPKSSPSLPVEKTVKKLLELLVAAKTAGERSLISNLVTTLLTNSLKKDDVLSPPTSLASIKNVVEQHSRQGIKRPASSSSDETPRKELKTVLKTPAPVKPSIIMVEQPEQVCANFVLSNNRIFVLIITIKYFCTYTIVIDYVKIVQNGSFQKCSTFPIYMDKMFAIDKGDLLRGLSSSIKNDRVGVIKFLQFPLWSRCGCILE